MKVEYINTSIDKTTVECHYDGVHFATIYKLNKSDWRGRLTGSLRVNFQRSTKRDIVGVLLEEYLKPLN